MSQLSDLVVSQSLAEKLKKANPKLCPTCTKVYIQNNFDVCAACSNRHITTPDKQPHEHKDTVEITFEGNWKWIGTLPEAYMVRLCAYADTLQNEANDNGDLEL